MIAIIITNYSLDDGDKMRILIIEDDPLVALALRLYLTELGHTVVSTAADTTCQRRMKFGPSANSVQQVR